MMPTFQIEVRRTSYFDVVVQAETFADAKALAVARAQELYGEHANYHPHIVVKMEDFDPEYRSIPQPHHSI